MKLLFKGHLRIEKYCFYFCIFSLLIIWSHQALHAEIIENKKQKAISSIINIKPFFQESLKYQVKWMGITIGYISMVTHLDEKLGLVKSHVSVSPLPFVKKIYYVGGFFGSHWDYQKRKSHFAYEEVYQGKSYRKRSFHFQNNSFIFSNQEKKFAEFSLPHKITEKKEINNKLIHAAGYQDLLGAFYAVRSQPTTPALGDEKKIRVLPAGNLRQLILKVNRKNEEMVPFFGWKKILHVEAELKNPFQKNAATKVEEDLFFNTKSHIFMWITDDNNFVPVKIWTKVPYFGNFYLYLIHYSQP